MLFILTKHNYHVDTLAREVPMRCELLSTSSLCLYDQFKSQTNPSFLSGGRNGSPHSLTSQKVWVCYLSQFPHFPWVFHPLKSCFSHTFVKTLNKVALLAIFNPIYYVLLETLSSLGSSDTLLDFYSCFLFMVLSATSLSLSHLQMLEYPRPQTWAFFYFISSSDFHPHQK